MAQESGKNHTVDGPTPHELLKSHLCELLDPLLSLAGMLEVNVPCVSC